MSSSPRNAQDVEISVVIASTFRPGLEKALKSIVDSADHFGAQCEVIVVVNGVDRERTQALPAFPRVRYVGLQYAGKSRSLNKGINEARGGLIAFTDDDVFVSRAWLQELAKGAQRYPQECLFCGPIVPAFPNATPTWLRRHQFAAMLFADFRPPLQEGLLPKGLLPFGPNMAVRRAAAKAVAFRSDLGPSSENGGLFGEDTAYASELLARFGIFGRCSGAMFIPGATVRHCQEPSRYQADALYARCFNIGRTRALLRGGVSHLTCHPVLTRSLGTARSETEVFTDDAEINFYLGQAATFRALGQWDAVDFLIAQLAVLGDLEVDASLCASARQVWEEEQPRGRLRIAH